MVGGHIVVLAVEIAVDKRIVKEHWARTKSLERLIFGDVCTSIISIDSFGALDTTRVFYIATSSVYQMEENVVINIFKKENIKQLKNSFKLKVAIFCIFTFV